MELKLAYEIPTLVFQINTISKQKVKKIQNIFCSIYFVDTNNNNNNNNKQIFIYFFWVSGLFRIVVKHLLQLSKAFSTQTMESFLDHLC